MARKKYIHTRCKECLDVIEVEDTPENRNSECYCPTCGDHIAPDGKRQVDHDRCVTGKVIRNAEEENVEFYRECKNEWSKV
jgi:PHP family Zn ribbon phosphoesterase